MPVQNLKLLELTEKPDLREALRDVAGELERKWSELVFDQRAIANGGGSTGVGGTVSGGGGSLGGGGVTVAGGLSTLYMSAVAAESGITVGKFVHVREGIAAYLATATRIDRYATGVVTKIEPSGRLTVATFGKQSVACTVFANSDGDGRLWLSTAPGWAQDTQPAEGTGYIAQQIGVKASNTVTTGRTEAIVDIQRWDQLSGI